MSPKKTAGGIAEENLGAERKAPGITIGDVLKGTESESALKIVEEPPAPPPETLSVQPPKPEVAEKPEAKVPESKVPEPSVTDDDVLKLIRKREAKLSGQSEEGATPPEELSFDEKKLPPAVRQAMIKYRTAESAAKAEADKIRSEMAALQQKVGTAVPGDQVEALRRQLKEKDDQLAMINLELSSEFRQRYDEPIAQQVQVLNQYLQTFGLTGDETLPAQLVNANAKTRGEILLNAGAPDAIAAVTPILTQIDLLRQARHGELTRFGANKEQMLAQRQEQQRVEAQRLRDRLFFGGLEHVSANNFLLHKDPEDQEWNKVVDHHVARARQIIESTDMGLQVQAMIKGALTDPLMKMYLARTEEVTNLKKELARYRKHAHPLDTRDTKSPMPSENLPDTGEGVADFLLQKVRSR